MKCSWQVMDSASVDLGDKYSYVVRAAVFAQPDWIVLSCCSSFPWLLTIINTHVFSLSSVLYVLHFPFAYNKSIKRMRWNVNDITAPTYDSMMNPLLQALRDLGGSGTIEEINGRVIELMDLSNEQIELLHTPQ